MDSSRLFGQTKALDLRFLFSYQRNLWLSYDFSLSGERSDHQIEIKIESSFTQRARALARAKLACLKTPTVCPSLDSAFHLDVHRLCGAVQGSHFLAHWLNRLAECDQPRKTPLKYSTSAGN